VDPLTLSALGAVALSEGIKFLYGQASEILKRRRDRQQEASVERETDQVPRELDDVEILEGTLEPVVIDFDAADQLDADLKMLSQRLGNYANGIEEVDPTDEDLLRATDALRRVIEAIYQQRITFKGEARPPSGPLVDARVDVKEVVGYVAGVRAETIESGRVTSEVIAERVEQGAEAVGLDVKRIGGRRAD
jgi:hypothetical protein